MAQLKYITSIHTGIELRCPKCGERGWLTIKLKQNVKTGSIYMMCCVEHPHLSKICYVACSRIREILGRLLTEIDVVREKLKVMNLYDKVVETV